MAKKAATSTKKKAPKKATPVKKSTTTKVKASKHVGHELKSAAKASAIKRLNRG
jgi:hypothetical protein